MKRLLLYILATGLHYSGHSQVLDWAKQFEGPGYSKTKSMALDSEKSICTTGDFNLTVDFDPNPVVSFNLTSISSSDIFVAKLDSSGNLMWAKSYGSQGSPMADGGQAIAVDDNDNILVTGFFLGIINFNPGGSGGVLNYFGDFDIFVLKLDKNGNFLWAKQFGGPSFDDANAISTDSQGNVYVSGVFANTADFDPGLLNFDLVSAGGFDAYLTKLDTAGNFLWAKQWGGLASDGGQSIVNDALGNAYVAITFRLGIDLDPGPNMLSATASGLDDLLICGLNTMGNLLWAKTVGGSGADMVESMTLDESNLNLIFTGFFMGQVDFNPDAGIDTLNSGSIVDTYVCNWSAMGDFNWVRHFDGNDSQKGSAVAVDHNQDIYVTGWHKGTNIFCAGFPNAQSLSSQGDADIFICKLNSSGNLHWAYTIGGFAFDETSSMMVDDELRFYLTGNFRDTVDFDLGQGSNSLATQANLSTAFVVRYNNDLLTALKKEDDKEWLEVFPNPAQTSFTLLSKSDSEITLIDFTGRKVWQSKIGSGRTTFSTEGLAPGLYFLQQNIEGEANTQRLVFAGN